MLSQFCRTCQGNYAVHRTQQPQISLRRGRVLVLQVFQHTLTIHQSAGRLERSPPHSTGGVMADTKWEALRQAQTLHPHPDRVRTPLFLGGSVFFDPRDLIQVKYELLRHVRVEGDSVTHAAALFGLSRPTFYAAQAAWEQQGLAGLVPERTGPRQGHKLTEEVVARLRPLAATHSSRQLAVWLHEQWQLDVHPRSIERALARAEKKGDRS
jgi:transposase